MDEDLIHDMDNSFDFAVREVQGGWIVKYLRGWDSEDNCGIYTEQVFTEQETMLTWLQSKMMQLKLYRNKIAVTKDNCRTYIDAEI